MTEIVCQRFTSGVINVSNSSYTVVENITFTYCTSALAFDATVNTTVRNVTITDSFIVGLKVLASQHFTLTKSTFENCRVGIFFTRVVVIGDIEFTNK